jgi:DnaJ family protein C protein 3
LTDSRTAAKTAHPDVGGSEEKMAALNEAYGVLSNAGEINCD